MSSSARRTGNVPGTAHRDKSERGRTDMAEVSWLSDYVSGNDRSDRFGAGAGQGLGQGQPAKAPAHNHYAGLAEIFDFSESFHKITSSMRELGRLPRPNKRNWREAAKRCYAVRKAPARGVRINPGNN